MLFLVGHAFCVSVVGGAAVAAALVAAVVVVGGDGCYVFSVLCCHWWPALPLF